jgi:peptidoglycan hydrolase-like protein with peptidoglycan-binding domain
LGLAAAKPITNVGANRNPNFRIAPVLFRRVARFALFLVTCLALVRPVLAQEGTVWLQIEAQPTLAEAAERAQAYSSLFPETAGFKLRSGWFAVMIGPYRTDEAQIRLDSLKREGLIAQDSFIAYPQDFGTQFWPPGGAIAPPVDPVVTEEPVVEAAPDDLLLPDETKAEARDSETLLTEEGRKELQVALQWFGFYAGAIDGDYGPGTRKSMAAWQEAKGVDPTGILTTRQRRALVDGWRAETAAFGFSEVTDDKAGITVTLPLALVEFDHYEPPFVHFHAKEADAPRIVLISQPGDQAALFGLYDILQTLEAVPLDGARDRGEQSFRIRGTSGSTDTTVFAALKGGMIKGWMLISTPGNQTRDTRILQILEASFDPSGDQALDPGMVAMDAGTKAGLLSGLEVRKPRFSRSGLFVDAQGTVLTTVDAVTGCGRITLDRSIDATVKLADAASGLALVTPRTALSPRQVAEFQTAQGRVGGEIVVAGYSYEDRLPAPVLTFGTLEDMTGLNGEPGLRRLGIEVLAGDAGGPVLDGSGAVIGMLLPAGAKGDRQLPPGVHFAAAASEITRVLGTGGITPLQSTRQGTLPPIEMTEIGTGMTALVSCWD